VKVIFAIKPIAKKTPDTTLILTDVRGKLKSNPIDKINVIAIKMKPPPLNKTLFSPVLKLYKPYVISKLIATAIIEGVNFNFIFIDYY